MKITYPMIDAAIGSKLNIAIGVRKGTWIKLNLDHTGQLSPKLQSNRYPFWANVETGEVLHGSWLIDEETS